MIRAIGVATLVSVVAFGQTFEVASVKIHPGDIHEMNIVTSGPRLRVMAEHVGELVMYAYDLKRDQLAFASPSLGLDDLTFDIEAKAEGDSALPAGEFRKMLQSLLASRFKLQFHREKRETNVFALLIAKNGPKFKESASDAVTSRRHGVNGRNQSMLFSKVTMEDVIAELPLYTGRPVIDKTGLTGIYDIKLEATPLFRMNNNPNPADISVFVAIQDQLGLKLESQKAMIDVLVIDHVEKPTVN
jgi:uncharacterized protein (TIGR03435 family)